MPWGVSARVRNARDWAAAATGRTLARLVRRVSKAATLSVTSAVAELDGGQRCGPLAARLLRDAAAGHVIVPFWSAHQVTIALLAVERFGLRPALERFEVVADDSFGGEIMRHLGDELGLKMRPIHARGNPRRLEDVGTWLRDPAPFFIAVDGGSQYGTVPTGIVRLAGRLGSTIWPLAVRARRFARVPGLVAEIPLPGAAVALGVAAPLRVSRDVAVGTVAEDIRQRLEWASEAAAVRLRAAVGECAIWHARERHRTV